MGERERERNGDNGDNGGCVACGGKGDVVTVCGVAMVVTWW